MMEQLHQDINRAFDLEESGNFEEAMRICNECAQNYPDHKNEIDFEIAKMNYRNGREEIALCQFLNLFDKTRDNDILTLILEVYYYSYQEELIQRYQQNYQMLVNYEYYYGKQMPAEIRYCPIFAGEQSIWYYDIKEKQFHVMERYKFSIEEVGEETAWLVTDILWLEDILQIEQRTRIKKPLLDMETPLLLVYQEDTWELLLQLLDLEELIKLNRIVFCNDENALKEPFLNCEMPFLDGTTQFRPWGVLTEKLNSFFNYYRAECERYRVEALEYYKNSKSEVVKHIKDGAPKILFLTSRFTTALQYHVRDCRIALHQQNIETELCIEKNRLCSGVGLLQVIQIVVDFKPDIIFCIDHFRFEFNVLKELKEIVWISWLQDDMSHIMDKETPAKLTEKDFIMNHFITWQQMKDVGYPISRTMDAPIVANALLYKPYELTEAEWEKYRADICMVCHAADANTYIETLFEEEEDESIRELVRPMLNAYCQWVLAEGKVLYTQEEMCQFITEYMKQTLSMQETEPFSTALAQEVYTPLNQRIYRQMLVDWLIEAGYKNIKLWGMEWSQNPKYKEYAMGAAQNGEVLSKILQSTRITLGNNYNVTGAARAWETMLSGAFYMSNYVPPQEDAVDIRKILQEGENLVVFHDKQDFLDKVDYYLSHDAERKQMAEKGRKAALEKMTYDALMKRMLLFLKNAV
ncbi:MAG: glycosyltransferase [Bacteroidales bacterium]|nr:glycosyltransferase [Lachnoclostridium sp.]MCM1383926.1 glycosyltransferase [Lachnoclostridium sp.]MCM1464635.1 glycosyltransferase [Bacteroidales bacterium]